MYLQAGTGSEISGPTPMPRPELLTAETKLIQDLKKGYQPFIRPVRKATDNVTVHFGVTLLGLIDVDEVKGHASFYLLFHQSWTDVQLQWDPSKYDGLKKITIYPYRLWKPDITQFNSPIPPTRNRRLYPMSHVFSSGQIHWSPADQNTYTCEVDLTYFPSDTMVCKTSYGSWVWNGNEVELQNPGSSCIHIAPLEEQIGHETREFHVVSVGCQRTEKVFGSIPYQWFSVNITLKRQSSRMYFQLFVGPGFLLAVSSPFVFILPPDEGHKFILGTSVLVSQTLLMLGLSDAIPPHPRPPILSIYYQCLFILTVLTLVSSVITTNIYMRANKLDPPPWWLRKALFRIGEALCVNVDVQFRTAPGEQTSTEEDGKVPNATAIDVMADWRTMATCMDRFMFVLFLVIAVIISIITLPIITSG